MRYARIDTSDNAIREFRDFADKPEDIPHKNVKWLPAPVVPAPIYDPARQVLEGPTYRVTDAEVLEEWSVRDKTAEELSADIDAKIARIDEATRKALESLDARVTTLEGKQSRGFFGFLRSLFGAN